MNHNHDAWLRRMLELGTPLSRTSQRTASVSPWLSIQRFDYAPLDSGLAVVQLLGELEADLAVPADPKLLVWRRWVATSHPACACTIERSGSGLLLHVSFDVPLKIVEWGRTRFELAAPGHAQLVLPSPTVARRCDRATADERIARATPRRVSRHLLALGAGLAVVAGPSVLPSLAPAASTADAGMVAKAPHPAHVIGSPVRTRPRHSEHAQPKKTATGPRHITPSRPVHTAPATSHKPTPPAKPEPSAPDSKSSQAQTRPADCSHTVQPPQNQAKTVLHPETLPQCHPDTSTDTHPRGSHPKHKGHPKRQAHPKRGGHPKHDGHPTQAGHPKQDGHPTKPERGSDHAHSGVRSTHRATHAPLPAAAPRPRGTDLDNATPIATTTIGAPQSVWNSGFNVNPFTASELAQLSSLIAKPDQPPKFLIPIYKAASRRYHIPWQILAAINAIETDYGRNLSTSPAGAIGFMQFMPATWMQYGVAADGNGHQPDPFNARDAIFSAARYLVANGGRQDIRKALFAYNHAQWYVESVLWRAQLISDRSVHAAKAGYALPLDGRYMRHLGRTDDGLDIESAPDGAAVYSITPGIVTAVASNPSGFGPNYPVIMATAGPLTGQYIYYGHVAASLVHVGQHVVAGEPIAVMGHTGDAASLGHGHIEIGFSDGSGDPLNHHGSTAWTPSGDTMRHVLVTLSADFGIKAAQ